MIAFAYLFVLIALAVLGVGAAYLVSSSPPGGPTLLACGTASVLAAIVLVVGVTYGVARPHAGRTPAAHRADRVAILVSMVREALAHFGVFVVLAPFAKVWIRDGGSCATPRAEPPVLLVHGYLLNGAAWWRFGRLLEKAGFQVHAVSLSPWVGPIDAMAETLGRRIEALRAATGAPRVHLVAHSMGGLVCRAYLRAHGAAQVARFVTIAGPHHGTKLARLGLGAAARAMLPASPWLAALADAERHAEHPPTVALFSYYDNYIVPPESATLPWARNAPLPPLGHVEMYFSGTLAARVCAELRARSA